MYNQQLQFAPPATAEHATEDTVGLFRTVTSQPDAVNHRRSPAREINLPLAQVVPMLGQGRAALPTVALMEPAAEGRPPRVSPGGSYPVNGWPVSYGARVLAADKWAPAGVREPSTVRGHLHDHCTTGVWTVGAREYSTTIADIEASRRGHHQLRTRNAELQQGILDGIFRGQFPGLVSQLTDKTRNTL